jgi:creatinine amidohydrolase/Fe(II)-dependent formamide hydrolase-like protein
MQREKGSGEFSITEHGGGEKGELCGGSGNVVGDQLHKVRWRVQKAKRRYRLAVRNVTSRMYFTGMNDAQALNGHGVTRPSVRVFASTIEAQADLILFMGMARICFQWARRIAVVFKEDIAEEPGPNSMLLHIAFHNPRPFL